MLRRLLVAIPLCIACALLLDVPLARWVDSAPPGLHAVAEVFSGLGLSGYMLGISGLTAAGCGWLARSNRLHGEERTVLLGLGERALFVFAAVAASGLIVQIVKHVVGRARPSLLDTHGAFHFDLFSMRAQLASFPSGHTTSIFALAAALSLLVPRASAVWFPVAIAVGAARIVLDAHYTSDILAGAVLGTITTVVVAATFAERSITFTRRRGLIGDEKADKFGLLAKPFYARGLP